jgi:hypothetical protein
MPDHIDKRTFRVPVKLVNAVDQSDLPIEGFVMIPEDRLRRLETVARTANALLDGIAKTGADQGNAVEAAKKQFYQDVAALAEIWDIPKATA